MKDLSFHFVTRGNKYEFSLSEEKEKLSLKEEENAACTSKSGAVCSVVTLFTNCYSIHRAPHHFKRFETVYKQVDSYVQCQ